MVRLPFTSIRLGEDLHLQTVKHARHTRKGGRRRTRRPRSVCRIGRLPRSCRVNGLFASVLLLEDLVVVDRDAFRTGYQVTQRSRVERCSGTARCHRP